MAGLRWVEDPLDWDAVWLASARDEAWMSQVIATQIADGWNRVFGVLGQMGGPHNADPMRDRWGR